LATAATVGALALLWQSTKPLIRKLCNHRSDEPTPWFYPSDEEACEPPRWPWMRFKKVLVDGVPYRSALGKMCLICWNAFLVARLEEQHGSLRQYLEWKSTGIERHHAFVRAVEA
jgi:hypothetical protein